MSDQTQAPQAMTETEAQALAWRLHGQLPLGWYVAEVGNDPRPDLGWYVELRNDQPRYQTRLFHEADVAQFADQFGTQHPVEFRTDSFLCHFRPEGVDLECAEPGVVAVADVIEFVEWGQRNLAFLKTLAAKQVQCPSCGRTDCKLERVDYLKPERYLWSCWDGHWFVCSYDFEGYEVLSGEPEPEPEIDLPF